MPKTSKPKRDWFDKIDLAIKAISGILLAGVFWLVQHNNDLRQQQIDNSLKYGEFTQKLTEALITNDPTHLQQDLAFITLNHTIGKLQSPLVMDLGARIVEKYIYSTGEIDMKGMQSILTIISKKDSTLHKALLIEIKKREEELHKNAANKAQDPDKPGNIPLVARFSDKDVDKLKLIPSKAIIFIQINDADSTEKTKVETLQAGLKEQGYSVPGIEVISDFPFGNSIRYYANSDERIATKLFNDLKGRFVGLKSIKRDGNSKRSGLIELWLNYKPRPLPQPVVN